jgi:hypothetical protein
MKIAICAIAKNENQYLDEWITHYQNLGFDKIIIYDNNSEYPIEDFLQGRYRNVDVIHWEDSEFKSQSRAYKHCADNNLNYDFIGFFDIDEFLQMRNHKTIQSYLMELKEKHGTFHALGIYWRIYGNNPPFEMKQPQDKYTMYFEDKHIKSIVKPEVVKSFPDPHKAEIFIGKYINENGQYINSPIGQHTSNDIWIKHIFTRSRSEFAEKIIRGDANLRVKNRTWDDFENYNKLCKLKDNK